MKHLPTLVVVAFVAWAGAAHAQDASDLRAQFQADRLELQAERADLVKDVQAVRADVRDTLEDQRTDVQAALDAAATPQERQAILDQAKIDRETTRSDTQANRDELRDRAHELFAKRADLAVARFGAVLERGESIIARLREKISALEADGIDASGASDLVDEGEAALDDAAAHFREAQALHDTIDLEAMDREEVQGVVAQIRELLKATREDVRLAWDKLRGAVGVLKELVRSNNQ